MPALPEAVGVPGKLAEAPVIAVQLAPAKVVATVCVAFTAPLPPPVYDGKLIVSPVPVLPAEVVNRKIIDEAPPACIFVSSTCADDKKAAEACAINKKFAASTAAAAVSNCALFDINLLIRRSILLL